MSSSFYIKVCHGDGSFVTFINHLMNVTKEPSPCHLFKVL